MAGPISRRAALETFAALSVVRGASPLAAIDTHVHFYDPTRLGGVPWPPATDSLLYRPRLPRDLEPEVRPLGIEGVIVVEASPWLEDNQWVLDLAARNPFIKGVVGHLEPGADDFARKLARFAESPLFRGIRIGAAAIQEALLQPAVHSDLQRLAGANLSLDVIGGGEMLRDVARLADRLAHLRIVIDHLPFDSVPDALLRDVGSRTNVYAKVSGVIRKPALTRSEYGRSLDPLWEAFGPERLVYASNWPVSERLSSYAVMLGVVRDYFTGKGVEASRLFFRSNSQAAYRWQQP